MSKTGIWAAVAGLLTTLVVGTFAPSAVVADASVSPTPFEQDWSDPSLITRDDDWSRVPAIVGYRGDDITTATGADPQTLLAPAGPAGPVVDVIANQSNPDTLISGGVAEFDGIPNPTIALQGSGTADAPNIVIAITTTGKQNIRVRYNVRDIDGSADNAVQPVALQYRIGDSGNFTNVPAAFVADATTGPNLAVLVTPVSAALPPGVNNKARVELRIITANAVGNDEWVGIDDIRIDGDPLDEGCGALDISPTDLPGAIAQTAYSAELAATGAAAPAMFAVTAGALPRGVSLSSTGALRGFVQTAGTFRFTVTVTDGNACTVSREYSLRISPPLITYLIGSVQGPGAESPYIGQTVAVQGVVTAVTTIGFFVQSPDNGGDGDPRTSDGLFVFLGTAPSKPPRGASVAVHGDVVEFRPTGDSGAGVTQIGTGGSPATFAVLETGLPLPSPATLSVADLDAAGPYNWVDKWEPLERYEGMRVELGRPARAVAPTDSSGTFYAVSDTITYRPRREQGIERNVDPPPASERPAGAPAFDPITFDTNPEVFGVLTTGQTGAPLVNVATGATVERLVGVLDFVSGKYTIRPDAGTLRTAASTIAPTPVRAPLPNEFTAATMNLERIATQNDPAFQYAKVANSIVRYLRMPDVIAVEELASLAALRDLATAVNSAAAAEGAQPRYVAYLETSPNDVIHVGFLVKSARLSVTSVRQVGAAERFGGSDLNDRPPLILRAVVDGTLPVTVVAVHQRSLLDANLSTPGGAAARAKRAAQTEWLSRLLGGKDPAEPNLPNERTIVLGDFNAYEVQDGYVDVVNGARGAPADARRVFLPSRDNVDPDYANLYSLIDDQQRYSYLFHGDAQPLDHILVSEKLFQSASHLDVLHINAEFPSAFKATDPVVRYSDHDNPIAYFFVTPPEPATGVRTDAFSSSPFTCDASGECSAILTLRNLTTGDRTSPVLAALAGLPPGVTILNQAGRYRGSPFFVLGPVESGASVMVPIRMRRMSETPVACVPVFYIAAGR